LLLQFGGGPVCFTFPWWHAWFVPVLVYVPRLLKLLKHLEWVKQYVFSFSWTEIMLLKVGTMFRVAQCNTYKF
jgi:hypothetical protein